MSDDVPRGSVFENQMAGYGVSIIIFNFLDIACNWLRVKKEDVLPELIKLEEILDQRST